MPCLCLCSHGGLALAPEAQHPPPSGFGHSQVFPAHKSTSPGSPVFLPAEPDMQAQSDLLVSRNSSAGLDLMVIVQSPIPHPSAYIFSFLWEGGPCTSQWPPSGLLTRGPSRPQDICLPSLAPLCCCSVDVVSGSCQGHNCANGIPHPCTHSHSQQSGTWAFRIGCWHGRYCLGKANYFLHLRPYFYRHVYIYLYETCSSKEEIFEVK